jgi:hypothetical protein
VYTELKNILIALSEYGTSQRIYSFILKVVTMVSESSGDELALQESSTGSYSPHKTEERGNLAGC